MSLPAIKIEGLWKECVVGRAEHHHTTFYNILASAIQAPETERFWALRDITLEVQPREVVGIIDRNGAGKSTLLKVLSRITAPTRGRVTIRGRLASLLEVGTGFHPEFSGRENIFLDGAILGITRAEIARKFDETSYLRRSKSLSTRP
jgi:lipopolysaccharide transport system ATP-binding protein